jgi:hypothetical protein
MKRTSIFVSDAQMEGLKRAVKGETVGTTVAHLIRVMIDEGLTRRKVRK